MNNHKYYLQIDGEIIDFEYNTEFENMDSFLNLSLFTSCYSGTEDLIVGLQKMNLLLQYEEYRTAGIVKRKGNKKSGYTYEPIYEDILYKKASRYLSVHSISEFLHENRQNFPLLRDIISYYLNLLERLTEIFKHKIIDLKSSLRYTPEDSITKVTKEIQSKENSLKNFAAEISNLSRLLIVAKKLEQMTFGSRSLELEYYERVDRFVRNETGYYIKDKKISTNYRGLVRLANTVQHSIEKYPEAIVPEPTTQYINERLAILTQIKQEMTNQKKVNISNGISNNNDFEPLSDPDSFMFLEPEDYEKLLQENTPTIIRDGVLTDIENLQEQQQRIRKK